MGVGFSPAPGAGLRAGGAGALVRVSAGRTGVAGNGLHRQRVSAARAVCAGELATVHTLPLGYAAARAGASVVIASAIL